MERTLIKFLFIFILYNWYKFSHCCLPQSIGTLTPDHAVEVGDTLILNCSLSSFTAKLGKKNFEANSSMLSFKHNGQYITENIHILDPLTIQLKKENASLDDNGQYYCFANATIDKNKKMSLICASTIYVGYKPLPVENFTCISYHYKNLSCSWDPPYNPVKTTYTLQDYIGPHKSNEYLDGKYLRDCPEQDLRRNVCNWTLSSSAPYRKQSKTLHIIITGNNSLGVNNETVILDHYSRVLPSEPTEIKINNLTSHGFIAKWAPPEGMRNEFIPGLTYQLQYRSEYRKENNWEIIEVNKSLTAEVTDLTPYTWYDIKLRCRSAVARTENMWSGFINTTKRTEPDVPYDAPIVTKGLFEIRNILNSRNITLYWQVVPKEYWNGEDFHYIITYYQTSARKARDITPIEIREDGFSVVLSNMNHDTSYTFNISTANSVGRSKKYVLLHVDKKENTPSAPKDIKVLDYGHGKYHLSWVKPNDSRFIVNYTIFWCKAVRPRPFPCKEPLQWTVVPPQSDNFNLMVIDKDSNYHFAISSNTKTASSGLGWVPCIVPHNRALNKIKKVILQPVDSTTIKVTWYLDCSAQKYVVQKYVIYYCEVPNDMSTHCRDKTKNVSISDKFSDSYSITGLKPYTSYGVNIFVQTFSGMSEPSDFQIEKTKAGAPDPPIVRIVNTTSTTIQLISEPLYAENNFINKYSIFVTMEGSFSKVYEVKANGRFSRTIEHLKPYTNYSIDVKACADSMCSTATRVKATTAIGVPGYIDPPILQVVNATFVEISWLSPQSPNGPLDYYVLHWEWEEDGKMLFQEVNVTGREYEMTLDCSINDKGIIYAFTIQAANIANGIVLYGNTSDKTQTTLCFINRLDLPVIIGITVGGALGLAILVLVLYVLVRWMKKKVDIIKDIKVQLPTGLESPQGNPLNSYENFKNGLIRKASDSNLSPKTLYGRLSSYASDEGDVKDQHDSGASQFSNNSAEELIHKTSGDYDTKRHQSNGDNNLGKGHDSISSSLTNRTQLSSDSGAETDVQPPPSPESENGPGGLPHSSPQPLNKSPLPKVDEAHSSDSKDSGLEKEDGSSEKENDPNHYSRFVRYLDNPLHPYNKRQFPTTTKNVINQQLPYSKFGVNMPGVSGYIPLASSLIFMSRSLANSEPSVVDADKINENNQDVISVTESQASPYSKYGLARSLGETMNAPDVSSGEFDNGYSRCGVAASDTACFQQPKELHFPTPVITNSSFVQDNQLTSVPKSSVFPLENTSKVLPACTIQPKSNGYVTVDRLIMPKNFPLNEPNGNTDSHVEMEQDIKKQIPQSKGYVSVQDAKEMLSGKEKALYQIEPKEQTAAIPGYSKFDIQCNRLQDTSNNQAIDPVLTGTKPKLYPTNNHQKNIPYYDDFSDTNNMPDDKQSFNNLDSVTKEKDNSNIFSVETNALNDSDIQNNASNQSPFKNLPQSKVCHTELNNGYVRVGTDFPPDSVKVVPNDNRMFSSLTDTAV